MGSIQYIVSVKSRVGNSLFRSFVVASLLLSTLKRATVSNSLSSLFKKERLWINRAQCSLKKSDIELNAHVAPYKERPRANCSQFLLKRATSVIPPNVFFGCFFYSFFPLFMSKECIVTVALLSFFKRVTGVIRSHQSLQKSYSEQIAPVALFNRATMSDLLRSLFKKEQCERFILVSI